MSDTVEKAESVVRRIVAQKVPEVTDEDAAVLIKSPQRSLMMDKLLAVYWNQKSDFAQALVYAEAILERERSAENAKNVAMLFRRNGKWHEGIAFCHDHIDLLDPIQANDLLCMLHRSAGHESEAVRHGNESLRLKDASVAEAAVIRPRTSVFDPERPEQNIIAFSLWGSDRRYVQGAINNTIVARYLYPGWRPRIYVDAQMGDDVIRALIENGAQVLRVSESLPARQYGLFWRFLVEDDPNVALWLCRDADSVMNIKERAAVEDWLASGRAFHVMRDTAGHAELILAGMWGAHRGNIGGMRQKVENHVSTAAKALNNRITDQEFLRWSIWPIVRQDVLVHDSHFSFGAPQRYRSEFRLPKNRHIGQNDWIHSIDGQKR